MIKDYHLSLFQFLPTHFLHEPLALDIWETSASLDIATHSNHYMDCEKLYKLTPQSPRRSYDLHQKDNLAPKSSSSPLKLSYSTCSLSSLGFIILSEALPLS
jgi:hypothetical protein